MLCGNATHTQIYTHYTEALGNVTVFTGMLRNNSLIEKHLKIQ